MSATIGYGRVGREPVGKDGSGVAGRGARRVLLRLRALHGRDASRACAPSSTTRFMFINSQPAPKSRSDSRAQPRLSHASVWEAHSRATSQNAGELPSRSSAWRADAPLS
eukprot:scaffold388_cov111-Isochrysis_galbana.AAC.5